MLTFSSIHFQRLYMSGRGPRERIFVLGGQNLRVSAAGEEKSLRMGPSPRKAPSSDHKRKRSKRGGAIGVKLRVVNLYL